MRNSKSSWESNHAAQTKLVEINEQWDNLVTQAREEIVAVRALAHESATLQGATNIWETKGNQHSKAFWLGLLVLAVVILGGLGSLLYTWREVLEAIPRKPDGDIAYGIVALLAVPVVGVAWLLRIIARFVTNSMTLNEDVQQRKAMLETYFRLVGDPNPKMEATDRILVLNAIFRPLSGYQRRRCRLQLSLI